MKVPSIVNSQGVVHNWMNANCPVVKRVHEVEYRGGRELHRVVNGKQVKVFGLPGCNECWGSMSNFKAEMEVL